MKSYSREMATRAPCMAWSSRSRISLRTGTVSGVVLVSTATTPMSTPKPNIPTASPQRFRVSRRTSATSPWSTRSTASRHVCHTTTTAKSFSRWVEIWMKTSGSTITPSSTSCSVFRSQSDGPSSSRPSTSPTSPTPPMKAPPTGSARTSTTAGGQPWV